jgi:hypothetical protein
MPTIAQFPPPVAALYHAAGHAVVAWHFAMRIHSIAITVRDPVKLCNGKDLAGIVLERFDGSAEALPARLAMLTAGSLADQLATVRAGELRVTGGGLGDLMAIEACCKQAGQLGDQVYDWYTPRSHGTSSSFLTKAVLTASQVLKDRWSLVVALVDRLATSPSMTGEELEALLCRAAEN